MNKSGQRLSNYSRSRPESGDELEQFNSFMHDGVHLSYDPLESESPVPLEEFYKR